MRDIKMSLATAIAAAGITLFSGQALAQDVSTESTADNDRVTLTQSGASKADTIPATSLHFRTVKVRSGDEVVEVEITPDRVKEAARKGRFLAPVAREEQTYSISDFVKFVQGRGKRNQAGIFIGVVVDDTTQPYRPLLPGYTGRDHFRAIHKRIAELVTGYDVPKGLNKLTGTVDEATRVPGIAEKYGAEITGIVPLRYFEGAERIDQDGTKIPIRPNDIFIMVNDHVLPVALDDTNNLPNSVEGMEGWLLHYLKKDRHLYTWAEYQENKDTIIAHARDKYEQFAATQRVDRR